MNSPLAHCKGKVLWPNHTDGLCIFFLECLQVFEVCFCGFVCWVVGKDVAVVPDRSFGVVFEFGDGGQAVEDGDVFGLLFEDLDEEQFCVVDIVRVFAGSLGRAGLLCGHGDQTEDGVEAAGQASGPRSASGREFGGVDFGQAEGDGFGEGFDGVVETAQFEECAAPVVEDGRIVGGQLDQAVVVGQFLLSVFRVSQLGGLIVEGAEFAFVFGNDFLSGLEVVV